MRVLTFRFAAAAESRWDLSRFGAQGGAAQTCVHVNQRGIIMTSTADTNYAGVWDNRLGFGNTPVVIVIDLLKGYTTEGSALYAPGVVACLKEVPEVVEAARSKGVPVIHTRVLYNPANFEDGGVWTLKAPVLKDLVPGNLYAEFCDEVAPPPGETVLTKNYASCFFGTSLSSILAAKARRYPDHPGLHNLRLHSRVGGGRRSAWLPPDRGARMRRRPP